jgi:hypothetical protein
MIVIDTSMLTCITVVKLGLGMTMLMVVSRHTQTHTRAHTHTPRIRSMEPAPGRLRQVEVPMIVQFVAVATRE